MKGFSSTTEQMSLIFIVCSKFVERNIKNYDNVMLKCVTMWYEFLLHRKCSKREHYENSQMDIIFYNNNEEHETGKSMSEFFK